MVPRKANSHLVALTALLVLTLAMRVQAQTGSLSVSSTVPRDAMVIHRDTSTTTTLTIETRWNEAAPLPHTIETCVALPTPISGKESIVEKIGPEKVRISSSTGSGTLSDTGCGLSNSRVVSVARVTTPTGDPQRRSRNGSLRETITIQLVGVSDVAADEYRGSLILTAVVR